MTKICSLFKSPFGYITVVNDGFYVTNVTFGNHTSDYQFDQNDKVNNRVISELEEYFTGSRETFDVPLKFEGTDFQKKVWNALTKIPYGETHSYSDIADSIGKPTAIRAIGTATSKNPIAIIVPSHRVVNSSGELLGYSGGVSVKKRLLDIEKSKVMALNQKYLNENRMESESLNIALNGTDIYEYYYYPQDKLMVFPNRAVKDYNLDAKYENAPESFFNSCVYFEDKENFFKAYNSILEGEHSATAIYRNRDGSKWFRVVLSVTEYVNGKPSMAVGIFTEITNAKMREIEAKSSLSMHQEVILAIRDIFLGIHVLDLAKGTIRSIKSMSGLETFELNAEYEYNYWFKTISQFYHPSDRIRLAYQYSLESIIKCRDLGEHKIHETYRRFNGNSYTWISNCIILNNSQASRDTAIFIQTDVSDRYQKSNILNALGMEYYCLYHINVDEDTYESLYSDEMIKETLNLSSNDGNYSEFMSKYIDAFVYQDDVVEMSNFTSISNIRKVLSIDNRKISHVFRRRTAHNNYEWVQVMYILTVTDSNHFVTMALKNVNEKMRKDLNQKQLLEYTLSEAETDKQVKHQFLSKMSSDLRNPMMSIIGLTTLAKANLDNPTYLQGCLEQINLLGNDLLSLINEVLDMSSIENAEFTLNKVEFNFVELVQSILDIHFKQFEDKGITFTCLTEGITVGKVIGDVAKLQQLLTNLLSNELKYTNIGGKVRFTIKQLRVFDDNVVTYQLVLEDTGIGIDKEEFETIFKPFARSKDSRVQNITGAGLGLSIASKIVNLMDGKIELESTLNKGSRFTVTFNLTVSERIAPPTNDYSNINVLVVNSKDAELKNLCDTISTTGANITPMYLGNGALNEIISKHRVANDYHAVIIDKNLVDVNYLKLADSIRKIMGRNPLKVFISSYDCNVDKSGKLPNYLDGIIAKPIFMPYFCNTLDELNIFPLEDGENVLELKPLKGTKSLLISGDDFQGKIIQELFKVLGANMDIKDENVEAIVNAISHNDYDYIVIDTDEITNLENLVKIIVLLDNDIPIVAITSCNLQSYFEKLISYGINSHVVKPIDNNINYLVSTILSNLKDNNS